MATATRTSPARRTIESPRSRLLTTAERLIAEQGPAVSLREIAFEAGQRNNAAVQYHFGGRQGLIDAIIEHRQESLERERVVLLAEQEAAGRTDLRSLVEALVRPLFSVPYHEGATHYARFLEKIRDMPTLVALEQHDWPATTLIFGRISQALVDVPDSVRDLRLRGLMTTMFALLADLERTPRLRGERRALAEQNVADMLVGLLSAPFPYEGALVLPGQ